MDQDGLPPIINEDQPVPPNSVPRWRWWLHLAVLTLFPLLYGVLGLLHHEKETVLPKTVLGLLLTAVFELFAFATLFAGAWFSSRANADQLFLRWRGKGMPLLLGFAYSFALRIVVMIVMLAAVAVWFVVTGAHEKDLTQFGPHTQNLINAQAMVKNPVYFVLCVTLISFVVAALREELWRAGMFAGIKALFPKQFAEWRGKAVAVCFVALLFGLGHSIQGMVGVGVTAMLGLGLGTIMVLHKSIWEAVVAHGFFDATTFATIYVIAKYFPNQVPGL